MKLSVSIRSTDGVCSSRVYHVVVPGLKIHIWLCVSVHAQVWWFKQMSVFAVHLVGVEEKEERGCGVR